MNLFRVKMGGTLYIYDEESRGDLVEKLTAQARRTGEAIYYYHESGVTKVWFTTDPIVDTSQIGSAQYKWAKDGNRVKCIITKHSYGEDGHLMEKVGTCYVDFDRL